MKKQISIVAATLVATVFVGCSSSTAPEPKKVEAKILSAYDYLYVSDLKKNETTHFALKSIDLNKGFVASTLSKEDFEKKSNYEKGYIAKIRNHDIEAIAWFNKGSAENDALSQKELAGYYAQGLFFKQDRFKERELLNLAANNLAKNKENKKLLAETVNQIRLSSGAQKFEDVHKREEARAVSKQLWENLKQRDPGHYNIMSNYKWDPNKGGCIGNKDCLSIAEMEKKQAEMEGSVKAGQFIANEKEFDNLHKSSQGKTSSDILSGSNEYNLQKNKIIK